MQEPIRPAVAAREMANARITVGYASDMATRETDILTEVQTFPMINRPSFVQEHSN